MKKRKKMRSTFVKISVELLTKNQKNDTLNLYKHRRRAIKRLVMENGDKNMDNNVSNNIGEINEIQKIPQYQYKKISAFDAANYIIRLYYKTGEKYRCTKSKVEKLLSIAGFAYMAKNGEPLFEQDIVVNPCGTGFAEFSGSYPPEIIKGKEAETNCAIDGNLNELIDNGVSIPLSYQDEIEPLKPEIEGLLSRSFMRFADYAPKTLGKAIDVFKNEISCQTTANIDIIDSCKTKQFFSCSQHLDFSVDENIAERTKYLYENVILASTEKNATTQSQNKELVMKMLEIIVKMQIDEEKIIQKTLNDIEKYIDEEKQNNA